MYFYTYAQLLFFKIKNPQTVASCGFCCKFELPLKQIYMANVRNTDYIGATPILGYEGIYFIYPDGRILSNYTGKYLKPTLLKNGYCTVTLTKNKVNDTFFVHRLIAQSFLTPKAHQDCVNHKNGIKTDNRLENLEWCSRSENILHSIYVLGQKKNGRPRTKTLEIKPAKIKCIKPKAEKKKYYVLKGYPTKKIYQLLNGVIIKQYESINEAAKTNGMDKGCLCACLKGRLKKIYGYEWKYVNE